MSAQKARGADFESGNLIQRAKALMPILVPLFISAFRRADELATAMECRCYHGGEGRTRAARAALSRTATISLIAGVVAARRPGSSRCGNAACKPAHGDFMRNIALILMYNGTRLPRLAGAEDRGHRGAQTLETRSVAWSAASRSM